MKIASLVLKFSPEHAAAVRHRITAIPGATAHTDSGDGRMIILIEDGEGYAASDSILAVHKVPHVMSITLAYEYSDEQMQEATP